MSKTKTVSNKRPKPKKPAKTAQQSLNIAAKRGALIRAIAISVVVGLLSFLLKPLTVIVLPVVGAVISGCVIGLINLDETQKAKRYGIAACLVGATLLVISGIISVEIYRNKTSNNLISLEIPLYGILFSLPTLIFLVTSLKSIIQHKKLKATRGVIFANLIGAILLTASAILPILAYFL